MQTGNIYQRLPSIDTKDETFDDLVRGGEFKFQRIVSTGQSTPPGVWYDQSTDEWVVLLAGSATLRFENQAEPIEMQPGDYVQIPAHVRHRVERTSADEHTVWLALYSQPIDARGTSAEHDPLENQASNQ